LLTKGGCLLPWMMSVIVLIERKAADSISIKKGIYYQLTTVCTLFWAFEEVPLEFHHVFYFVQSNNFVQKSWHK
jgi:hypothetical protein